MSAQDHHHHESGHEHAADLRDVSRKRLLLALLLTGSFLVVEVVAGLGEREHRQPGRGAMSARSP